MNFIELEENALNEINGGLPWKTIGKVVWKGAVYVGEGIVGGAAWYAGEKLTQ